MLQEAGEAATKERYGLEMLPYKNFPTSSRGTNFCAQLIRILNEKLQQNLEAPKGPDYSPPRQHKQEIHSLSPRSAEIGRENTEVEALVSSALASQPSSQKKGLNKALAVQAHLDRNPQRRSHSFVSIAAACPQLEAFGLAAT